MPTLIESGGGVAKSKYEALLKEYSDYKSSHTYTNDQYTANGTNNYNSGRTQGQNDVKANPNGYGIQTSYPIRIAGGPNGVYIYTDAPVGQQGKYKQFLSLDGTDGWTTIP